MLPRVIQSLALFNFEIFVLGAGNFAFWRGNT